MQEYKSIAPEAGDALSQKGKLIARSLVKNGAIWFDSKNMVASAQFI